MNTDKLARLCHKLTPRERLPLIMAASARRYDAEKRALSGTAPQVTLSFSDYTPLAQAFSEVCDQHYRELLSLAATYFKSLWLSTLRRRGNFAKEMRKHARLLARLFGVMLAGWHFFCEDHGFDREMCWADLPGTKSILILRKIIQDSPELEGMPPMSLNPMHIAEKLWTLLLEREKWWGGTS